MTHHAKFEINVYLARALEELGFAEYLHGDNPSEVVDPDTTYVLKRETGEKLEEYLLGIAVSSMPHDQKRKILQGLVHDKHKSSKQNKT